MINIKYKIKLKSHIYFHDPELRCAWRAQLLYYIYKHLIFRLQLHKLCLHSRLYLLLGVPPNLELN